MYKGIIPIMENHMEKKIEHDVATMIWLMGCIALYRVMEKNMEATISGLGSRV